MLTTQTEYEAVTPRSGPINEKARTAYGVYRRANGSGERNQSRAAPGPIVKLIDHAAGQSGRGDGP